jgi:hypothetical protein
MSFADILRDRLTFAKPTLEALFSVEARISEWWAAILLSPLHFMRLGAFQLI